MCVCTCMCVHMTVCVHMHVCMCADCDSVPQLLESRVPELSCLSLSLTHSDLPTDPAAFLSCSTWSLSASHHLPCYPGGSVSAVTNVSSSLVS